MSNPNEASIPQDNLARQNIYETGQKYLHSIGLLLDQRKGAVISLRQGLGSYNSLQVQNSALEKAIILVCKDQNTRSALLAVSGGDTTEDSTDRPKGFGPLTEDNVAMFAVACQSDPSLPTSLGLENLDTEIIKELTAVAGPQIITDLDLLDLVDQSEFIRAHTSETTAKARQLAEAPDFETQWLAIFTAKPMVGYLLMKFANAHILEQLRGLPKQEGEPAETVTIDWRKTFIELITDIMSKPEFKEEMINSATLSRLYGITKSDIEQAVSNHWIQPKRLPSDRKKKWYGYSRLNTAILLFLHDHGTNFTPAQKRHLLALAAEVYQDELKKRAEEQL